MRLLALLILALPVCNLFAQIKPKAELSAANVYYNKPIEQEKGRKFEQFAGVNQSGVVAIYSGKDSDLFVSYDEELRVDQKRSMEYAALLSGKEFLNHVGVITNKENNKALRLYAISDPKAKVNRFYASKLDLETLEQTDPIAIGEIEGKDYYSELGEALIGVSYSPDSSKAVLAVRIPKNDKGILQVRTVVFDTQSFKVLWQRDFVLEEPGVVTLVHGHNLAWKYLAADGYKYAKYTDHLVIDNNGTVYTWITTDKRGSVENGRYSLLIVGMSEDGMQKEKVEYDNARFVFEGEGTVRISAMPEGCLVASVYAENGADQYKRDGMALTKLQFGENQKTVKYEPSEALVFDQLNKGEADEQKKRNAKAGKMDLDIYRAGSITCLGERYLLVANTGTDRFITLFDSNFNVIWEKKVRFFQFDMMNVYYDGLGGFYSFVGQDNFYFIFNDHRSNISKEWRPITNLKGFYPGIDEDRVVTIGKINLADSNVRSREKMWSSEKIGGHFKPFGLNTTTKFGNVVYTYIDLKKEERIVKVVLR